MYSVVSDGSKGRVMTARYRYSTTTMYMYVVEYLNVVDVIVADL